MNQTLALIDNDITLDADGNIAIVENIDSVIQNVTSAIRLWIGEYDFNTNLGMKYKRYLGGYVNFLSAEIKTNLKKTILSVTGVVSVPSIKYNYDTENNSLNGTATILTIYSSQATIVAFGNQ